MGLRHHLSDNEFFLSQLDVNFDRCYQQLLRAYRGFINGWFAETDRLAHLSRYDRADKLFEANGVVGAPLPGIQSLQDIDFKYRHQTYASLRSPPSHDIPPRIQRQIQQQYDWY